MGALLVNTFLIGIHHTYGVLFIAFRQEFGLSYDTACKSACIDFPYLL